MSVLRPDLFTSTTVYIDVETKGELTYGTLVADFRNRWQKRPQVNGIRAYELWLTRISASDMQESGRV